MLQCKMIRCDRYLVSIRKRKLGNKLSVVALRVCGSWKGANVRSFVIGALVVANTLVKLPGVEIKKN